MTDTEHHLTLYPEQRGSTVDQYDYIPPRASCSCGGWSFIGPHDLARQFHTNIHLKETAPDA